MRPPFAYYGGKVGLSRLIVPMLPRHRVYIEPFFGSGAVFFAKAPAPHEIVNDVDGQVVTFFRVLRERPDELAEACLLTPYSREEFVAAADSEDLDDLERARRFWVRVNQSFAKTAGRATGWSVTVARTQSTARSVMGRIARFHAVAERLAETCIEQCDGAELVGRLAVSDDTVPHDGEGSHTLVVAVEVPDELLADPQWTDRIVARVTLRAREALGDLHGMGRTKPEGVAGG